MSRERIVRDTRILRRTYRVTGAVFYDVPGTPLDQLTSSRGQRRLVYCRPSKIRVFHLYRRTTLQYIILRIRVYIEVRPTRTSVFAVYTYDSRARSYNISTITQISAANECLAKEWKDQTTTV